MLEEGGRRREGEKGSWEHELYLLSICRYIPVDLEQ